MAAAATIGSNHNSRANNRELRAGRGFWPGLAVTLKHSCRFASYMIIAKRDYPAELNIPLPFSLVNNNVHEDRLEVLPAYFWIHNLYALERNSWKTRERDKRKKKIQRIETDYLAPDTAEEIIKALSLLDGWLGEAGISPADMTGAGTGFGPLVRTRLIICRDLERSKRGQVIINPLKAIAAYREMLHYYAVKTVAAFFDSRPDLDFRGLCDLLSHNGESIREWVNIGGQVVPAFRVDELRKDIREGKFKNWDEIHRVYDLWDEAYPLDKSRHAWAVLAFLEDAAGYPDEASFKKELTAVLETRSWIDSQILETREKDFSNSFKKATFRNQAEMEQVLGKAGDSPFAHIARREGNVFKEMIERVNARLT
jgi:hypothetical protein